MTSKTCSLAAPALALILLAGWVPLSAAGGPQIEVETKVAMGNGWDVEVLSVDPEAAPNTQVIFAVRNLNVRHLATAQVAVTLQRADGSVRSYVHYVMDVGLDARETGYVTRNLPFPRLEDGDRLIVETPRLVWPGYGGRVSTKDGPAQCSTYCDNCADKALAVCVNGTSSYNCSCEEGTYSCNFDCFPPTV